MAEFQCYVCNKKVKTGEKFTFTNSGSVHFDCFASSRRKEVGPEKVEQLSVLVSLLDSELRHLLNILDIQAFSPEAKEMLKTKYKDIEKAAGETTRMISSL
ncbi:DUF2175 family protein [Oxyplasma meridianum]|uniref:DUF2175 family protein n=1 Tax=Oxyplasma meridianum TaxID=3073602 RepID=A0AAX4NH08_9ARCH